MADNKDSLEIKLKPEDEEILTKTYDLIGDKQVQFVYHMYNQESWAAAFNSFFKGLFSFATIVVILGFFGHTAGCIDMAKVIHG